MSAEAKKTDTKPDQDNIAKESVAKVNEWAKNAGEKLRDAATQATNDFKTAGSIAIEGEVAHNTRLMKLAGDLLNARTTATLSILQEAEFGKVAELERNFLKSAMETLNEGMRDLGEIRRKTLQETSQTYTERAHEVIDQLATPSSTK